MQNILRNRESPDQITQMQSDYTDRSGLSQFAYGLGNVLLCCTSTEPCQAKMCLRLRQVHIQIRPMHVQRLIRAFAFY